MGDLTERQVHLQVIQPVKHCQGVRSGARKLGRQRRGNRGSAGLLPETLPKAFPATEPSEVWWAKQGQQEHSQQQRRGRQPDGTTEQEAPQEEKQQAVQIPGPSPKA
jgi:hypothetical protein